MLYPYISLFYVSVIERHDQTNLGVYFSLPPDKREPSMTRKHGRKWQASWQEQRAEMSHEAERELEVE